MTEGYADQLRQRWYQLAFLCRFGHQDVYRLLGRDPMTEPLTALERALFCVCLQDHWDAEVSSRDPILTPPSPED